MDRRFPQDELRSCCKSRHVAAVAVLVAVIASGCASSRPTGPTAAAIPDKRTEEPVIIPAAAPVTLPEEVADSVPAPRWDLPDLAWSVEHLLREEVDEWFGTPHRMGGEDKNGVDCSAFVLALYRDLFGVEIPRTTSAQVQVGEEVSPEELQPGDLVFFRPGRSRHVGIYIQDGEFAHASESQGVTISRLDESYWDRAYWTSRRVLENGAVMIGAAVWDNGNSGIPASSLPAPEYSEVNTSRSARSGW